MRKLSVLCALSIVNSMFVSLLIVPIVSAQPDGWGTPELLEHDYMGDAEYPQVAVDPSGNAVAIWQQYNGSDYNVRSSRYVAGVGWTEPEFVQTNESGDSEYQQVDVDSAGNAVAVWSQWDGVTNNIWANRYEVGIGWGMAEIIETDPGYPQKPDVAVDPSGNALAVWEQNDGTSDNIWANRYVVGTGWGVAELIETNDIGPAAYPRIAVDPSGNAIAVWEQLNVSRYDIWANRYVVGVGWGTAELVETNDTGPAWDPQVAVDAAGNAVVVWYQLFGFPPNDITNIWANRYIVGTGWGTAEIIETDNANYGWYPQVAVDPSGNATAVWRQANYIWANRYEVGSGWGTMELIQSTTDNAWDPQVAVDATGNATAVWPEGDIIWANRYEIGVGWGTAEIIQTNLDSSSDPQVADASNGNTVVVWSQYSPAYYDIWANRYAVGSGWGTAELVEQDTGASDYPQIAVDPSGNAIAVWVQEDGTNFRTTASRYVEGSGWTAPSFVSMSSFGNDMDPQVAVDPNGNAMVVWTQVDSGPSYNIWSNRYVVGVGWGTAELAENNSTAGFTRAQVAMDDAGNAIAVWQSFTTSPFSVWANRYVVGVGWGTAELIETNDAGDAWYPQIAVDPSGNAIAVWHQSSGGPFDVWSNRFDVGTGWGTAEVIETNAWAGMDPQVAMDSSGNAIAVWYQWDGSDFSAWANRYVVGTGWGTAELIETILGAVGAPQVAVDPMGNAVAVWYQYDGVRDRIWSNRYVVGTGWGTAELIQTSTRESGSPQVAVDPIGNAMAVWYETAGPIDDLWSSYYDAGKGWGTPVLVETNDVRSISYPQVAMDASGHAIAVWEQTRTTDEDIWANRFAPPDMIAPIADAGPDQVVTVDDLVTFDGSGSTDNVGIVVYYWVFNDGGPRMLIGVSPTYSFYNVGIYNVTLMVMDANGNNDTDMVIITVNPAPDTERPVADAGPDQSVVAGTLVAFDGSGSSDNVGIVNYTWTFDDGGTRTLYGMIPSYLFSNVGVFEVTLTVSDAANNYDSDTVIITVTPPPDTEAPVANAGPDRNIVVGTMIILDGSASTDNVGIINYTWSFDDGGMKYRYTVMFAYQFSNVGVFTITLDVRDAAGNPDSDTVIVTVTAAPPDTERPVANAGPDQSVPAGTLVTFDGSASTDNIGVTNYTWTFNDGGARTRYGVAPTYTFNNIGVFVVTLTVKDAAGNSDSDEVVITVTSPPDTQNPVANAGPDRNIIAGSTIILDGSASTDNVGIVNYTWNFTDGVMRYRYTAMFAYQFSNAGTIVVTLTVRDAAGNTGTDIAVITVNPVTTDTERPIADAGPNQSVDTGTVVTFDGSGSTDNVGITNYTWSFDDGGARTLYEVSPTYLFNNAGTFVVTLTVKDAAGYMDEDVMVVVVTIPSTDTIAPVANAGPDQLIVAGSTTALDGSASTDNVGIVNYTWTFTYDGSSRTLYGQFASFKFDTVGSYTVTLTVRDAAGNSDTDEVVITVTAAPGGGEVEKEVMSPAALAAITIFAILMVIFALMWLMSRRKKGAGPTEETVEKEEEATLEEFTEEEEM